MALASFCGLLTLQVGCAVIAAVFFVLGILAFGINVIDYREDPGNSWPMNLLIVCIFIILMVTAGITMFMAAYNESRKLCLVTLFIVAVITIYWLILSLLSLLNTPTDVRRVCVEHRCGESFWLASMNYRVTIDDTEVGLPTSVKPEVSSKSGLENSRNEKKNTVPSASHSKPPGPSSNNAGPSSNNAGPTSNNAGPSSNNAGPSSNNAGPSSNNSTGQTSNSTGPKSSSQRRKRLLDGLVRIDEDGTALPSKETPQEMVLHSPRGPASNELTEHKKNAVLVSLSRSVDNRFKGREDYNSQQLKTHTYINTEENNEYKYGTAFAGAIIFCIVNLVFLIFTMVLVWSYAQELKWETIYYDSNAPVYR